MEENSSTQRKVKEPLRKDLTQCQYCYKSRLSEGVSLSKCAGCRTALYCSKECQKSAWPLHKETCKLNQSQELHGGQSKSLKTLRAFTAKHRPTIAKCGILAFDLGSNQYRGLEEILVVLLEPRRGSKRTETAFVFQDAYLRPVDSFGHMADEISVQMKRTYEENVRTGLAGGISIMLWDTVSGVSNIAPVGFPKDAVTRTSGQAWKEELMYAINHGIVY